MGWKISERTIRFLLCNEGSDDDTKSIRKTLEPFNLFVFVLHIPSIHLEFDRKLNEILDRLDLVTAESLLFFAFVEPDNEGVKRPETREYYKELQSWENKIFPNGSTPHDFEPIVSEIARSLDIPFDSLPSIIVSNNILAKKKRWYKTSAETIDEQLYQLGHIAREFPDIKTNWKYAGHIFEKNKQKIDLCNSSGSKLVSTDDLEEVISNLILRNTQSEIRSNKVIQKSRVAKKDAYAEPRYAFYPERPTWTITFDGKTLRGLRGKGFKYIHYLIENKFDDFSHTDLDQLDSKPVIYTGQFEDYFNKNDSNPYQKKKQIIDHRDMIDGKTLKDIKKEFKNIKEFLERAKRENNPIEIEMAQKEYDEFSTYYYENLTQNGRSKKFKTEQKKIRDRIAKNMKEALDEIKKYDETNKKRIWSHFNDALGGLYASSISYRPNPDIDWHT